MRMFDPNTPPEEAELLYDQPEVIITPDDFDEERLCMKCIYCDQEFVSHANDVWCGCE